MILHAVTLLLVLLLAGAAYGSSNREKIRYYPRDRVVEREVIRERPVYIEEKPSHRKWWQWYRSDRRDDRKREKEWEKDRKKQEKEREKWEKDRKKDRKRDH
jgi:hypothetical protein